MAADFTDILKIVIPGIATVMGGPLAGAAVGWIAGKLGVSPENTTAISDAVQGIDPLARKKLEDEFNQWLIEEQNKMILAYLADTQSARARDVELAKAGVKNTRANWIVGVTFVGILVCTGLAVGYSSLNEFGKSALMMVLGVMIADWKQITSFEFGTTKDSQSKNGTIKSLTEKL